MDVTVYTSDVNNVSAEDVATVLIEAGYYVHSVRVRHREMIQVDDLWTDGNE